ncbi:DEAD/DEAH box helicase family protein [Microbulbifer sp. YPW1]|uniref:DEAD/DEAH box helicase family protein n=1 Tax=Microbulbifer sp. YPW1 TaxID=2745199 RepID=UPI00159984D9|nr:DEAD/DEAH box helicase family protein [Microbulbifer sp. YPW1]QKX16922.1 DEAD/DEAH box helicase family protein [Microbulbifer sp. YPW1]
MSNSQVARHRDYVEKLLKENVFGHQRRAAKNTFSALGPGCRSVIMAAEMQSGKSGVALALACLQRNSLSDSDIVDQSKLRDTMYVLTMPNTDLLAQAKEDLKPCMNAVVTNLVHFENDLEKYFIRHDPKLIIIDECHYGSGESAVRYEKLFEYVEKKNRECSIVFISATPLSALLAAENEAVLRKDLNTKLVFHKASDEYLGITKMLNQGQVISLNGRNRNLLNKSPARDKFLSHVRDSKSEGWALIRVPSGAAMDAKKMLIKEGFEEENIFILGSSLSGVPANELIDIDQFKNHCQQGMLFGKKVIAITVAGVRAGINFGQEMKENLLASWDSTVSSVAAIVQANIGRACGYHGNSNALHFTNMSGVKAYARIVAFLEENCTTHATDDMEGLRDEFERICADNDIRGLDAGARINKGRSRKGNKSLSEYKAYHTDSYLVVPARLTEDFDYSQYTDDPEYLESIKVVRDTLISGGLMVKGSRSLPPGTNSVANWVNGDTFSNPEKAIAGGPVFERVGRFTTQLDLEHDVKFNDIVPAGGGVDINERSIAVFVFSIYNESRRDVEKKVMTLSDVHEVSDAYNVESDDTVLVLFKKGEFSQSLTDEFIESKIEEENKSRIVEESKFQRDFS